MSGHTSDRNEMSDGSLEVDDFETLAALTEPIRRSLYDFVSSAPDAVSRDQAAAEMGVSRQVAAYHLDRLADEGLLEFDFRRLTGRNGPGAGRPAKLYRRSDRVLNVSLPARRYELMARILLEAVGASEVGMAAIEGVARRTGRELGEQGLQEALTATGYEPATERDETRFRNCPFHRLRDQDRATTCGLNLALVEGIIEGSGSEATAVLAPEGGYCCVRLRPAVNP